MAANVDPNEEHEVEKVERSGTIDGRLYFSVKWVNPFDPNMKTTLVWADEMPNAQEAIGDYCKKVGVANTQELTAQILSGGFRRRQEEKAAAIKKKKGG
ncbi:unnamed protein product [Caenorhabditis brenneri]